MIRLLEKMLMLTFAKNTIVNWSLRHCCKGSAKSNRQQLYMCHAFLYLMNSKKEWQTGALQVCWFWNNLAGHLLTGLSVQLEDGDAQLHFLCSYPTITSAFWLEAFFRLSHSPKTGNSAECGVLIELKRQSSGRLRWLKFKRHI